jgi:hypothetical protein
LDKLLGQVNSSRTYDLMVSGRSSKHTEVEEEALDDDHLDPMVNKIDRNNHVAEQFQFDAVLQKSHGTSH